MIRDTMKIPGYACLYAPHGSCPGYPRDDGRNHGIHGEEWIYVVRADDGLTALALTVYTDILPDIVPAAHQEAWRWDSWEHRPRTLAERRHGSDLTLHVAFPYYVEGPDAERRHPAPVRGNRPCEILQQPVCESSITIGLGAHEFWSQHGDPRQHEQDSAFWQPFEACFAEMDADVRARRSYLTSSACPCCGGRSTVNELWLLTEGLRGVVMAINHERGIR